MTAFRWDFQEGCMGRSVVAVSAELYGDCLCVAWISSSVNTVCVCVCDVLVQAF
jgi:hypothetical protein